MTAYTKQYWSMTEGIFNCLIDKKRTTAFKRAIKNTVKRNDIVVDIGTGSGILAMFAVESGAKRVYAIESDCRNYQSLEKTFNSYKDKIILVKGDARKIALPQKVDVIICEMISTGLIEELQIPVMNHLLKFAKPNVRVVLKALENYVELVLNKDKFYGHRMKIVRYEYPGEENLKSEPMSNKIMYKKVHFSRRNGDNKVIRVIGLTICRGGVINGMRISSRTIFYDGSTFNGSFAYCYPIILPIEDIKVKKGDNFSVSLSYRMCEGFEKLKYEVT